MNRYKMVIHLTTTAIGAEELYTLKNNHARSESIEEAIELDKKTEQAWLGHPNRVVIDNSTGFDIKMLRALQALAKGIDMPKPTEIERKFKFVNFDQKFIPPDAVMVRVKQDYLKNEGTTERRIRLAELNGLKIFFYTKNEKTGEFGAGNKTEDVIRSKEYYNLRANERDSNFNTIKKTRYNFFYLGKKFELDVYKEPISFKDLVILKVELAKINEEIEFPSEWKLEDITGMEKYDSINLAKKK